MSKQKRVRRSAELKFQIAVEAVKGHKTLNEIATEYEVSPAQASQWKRLVQEQGPSLFRPSNGRQEEAAAQREAELYEQIGRLKMELEWLKKKSLG